MKSLIIIIIMRENVVNVAVLFMQPNRVAAMRSRIHIDDNITRVTYVCLCYCAICHIYYVLCVCMRYVYC